MEWVKRTYNQQYESWAPWLEDKYLALIGENKSSYVAKGEFFQSSPKSHSFWSCYPYVVLLGGWGFFKLLHQENCPLRPEHACPAASRHVHFGSAKHPTHAKD
jgi:hypothetical protein